MSIMPEIKLQHIVSVSSEDTKYPASNLLKTGGIHKWKTATNGEKNATAVIQFEKSSKIHSIHIGNEGSAFVEILVGKSTGNDFEVLLVASSFMSPLESRSGEKANRVRMFEKDKFSNTVLDQNWDRVKIVCTQPFNKNTTYGLSFINFNSPPNDDDSSEKKGEKPKLNTFGSFKLKSDDAGDGIAAGSLFARKNSTTSDPPPTGAAAMRAASRAVDESMPVSKEKPVEKKFAKETPVKPKESAPSSSSSSSSVPSRNVVTATPSSAKKRTVHRMSSTESERSNTPPTKKRKAEMPSSSSKKKQKPFDQLMKKVTFVLSGFKNPERGDLRDKAAAMGAQYKADWGKGCTHLICAFQNTPKYNQVKGKGRIVKKEWISDCHKQKELLPWRRYRLGKAPSPGGSSDETESEDERPPAKKEKVEEKRKPSPPKTKPVAKKAANDYSDSTDIDTDDEIERAKNTNNHKNSTPAATAAKDEKEDSSTDEDIIIAPSLLPKNELPPLPDFLDKKTFFLFGAFDEPNRKILNRLIISYKGKLENYMTDNITHILTNESWDENFDKALEDNDKLIFIKPDWIYACDDKQKLIPHQKYVVAPCN